MKNVLALALVALVLCGCVLQSRTPLFDDSQSALALGDQSGMTRTASYRNGQWEDEKEQLPIVAEGKHYVVRDKTAVTVHFIPLSGYQYAVQVRENDGPASYLLAEVKGKVAEARSLACADLKTNAAFAADVDYLGDDCFIRPGTEAKKLFTTLADTPGEASFRLEIVH
jgi:hypothetical protein